MREKAGNDKTCHDKGSRPSSGHIQIHSFTRFGRSFRRQARDQTAGARNGRKNELPAEPIRSEPDTETLEGHRRRRTRIRQFVFPAHHHPDTESLRERGFQCPDHPVRRIRRDRTQEPASAGKQHGGGHHPFRHRKGSQRRILPKANQQRNPDRFLQPSEQRSRSQQSGHRRFPDGIFRRRAHSLRQQNQTHPTAAPDGTERDFQLSHTLPGLQGRPL